jgi:hypothetical protein
MTRPLAARKQVFVQAALLNAQLKQRTPELLMPRLDKFSATLRLTVQSQFTLSSPGNGWRLYLPGK